MSSPATSPKDNHHCFYATSRVDQQLAAVQTYARSKTPYCDTRTAHAVRAVHLDAEDVEHHCWLLSKQSTPYCDTVLLTSGDIWMRVPADGRPGPAERGRRRRRPDRRPALRGRLVRPAPDVANDRAAFAFSINFVGALVAVGATLCVQFLSGFDYGWACLFVFLVPGRNRRQTKALRAARHFERHTGRRNQREAAPARGRDAHSDEQRLPNIKTSAQPTEKPQLLPQHKTRLPSTTNAARRKSRIGRPHEHLQNTSWRRPQVLQVAGPRRGAASAASPPKGKLRQRERKFPCTNPANTNLVPSRCYTEDQDFFHPDALLVEQLQDGDHLTVEVAPRVFVDEAGSPVKSRWQTIAFAVSPSSSAKRDAAIAEEYDAQNAKKVAAKAIEDEAERLENMRKADHIREIIKDQLPDPDQVEEALSEDWFSMNKKRVLDALVEDPEEQGRVKDVLKQHYVQLDELFKTFAASGSSIADAQDLELSSSRILSSGVARGDGPAFDERHGVVLPGM